MLRATGVLQHPSVQWLRVRPPLLPLPQVDDVSTYSWRMVFLVPWMWFSALLLVAAMVRPGEGREGQGRGGAGRGSGAGSGEVVARRKGRWCGKLELMAAIRDHGRKGRCRQGITPGLRVEAWGGSSQSAWLHALLGSLQAGWPLRLNMQR